MADPLFRQLLSQARRLAHPRRPRHGNLRRAISAAYYALFHLLVDEACRAIVGTAKQRRPYRDILARAFQHASMSDACKSFAGSTLPQSIRNRLPTQWTVPTGLRRVAQTFREAQERRHLADYDPAERLTRAAVLAFVRDVEEAIDLFMSIRHQSDSRFFLICLLAWNALSKRS